MRPILCPDLGDRSPCLVTLLAVIVRWAWLTYVVQLRTPLQSIAAML